jgi:hypothetical protein
LAGSSMANLKYDNHSGDFNPKLVDGSLGISHQSRHREGIGLSAQHNSAAAALSRAATKRDRSHPTMMNAGEDDSSLRAFEGQAYKKQRVSTQHPPAGRQDLISQLAAAAKPLRRPNLERGRSILMVASTRGGDGSFVVPETEKGSDPRRASSPRSRQVVTMPLQQRRSAPSIPTQPVTNRTRGVLRTSSPCEQQSKARIIRYKQRPDLPADMGMVSRKHDNESGGSGQHTRPKAAVTPAREAKKVPESQSSVRRSGIDGRAIGGRIWELSQSAHLRDSASHSARVRYLQDCVELQQQSLQLFYRSSAGQKTVEYNTAFTGFRHGGSGMRCSLCQTIFHEQYGSKKNPTAPGLKIIASTTTFLKHVLLGHTAYEPSVRCEEMLAVIDRYPRFGNTPRQAQLSVTIRLT